MIDIFKAGTSDIALLLYPAALILVAMLVVVGLGVFHNLSISAEDREPRSHRGGQRFARRPRQRRAELVLGESDTDDQPLP